MTNYDDKIYKMESFSVTTDGSGNDDITLDATPTDDNAIFMWCPDALRQVEFVSRAGAVVTLLIRKVGTKSDTTLGDLPGSVTATGTKQNTGGHSFSGSSMVGGGETCAIFPSTHTHGVSHLHDHSHTELADDNTKMKADTDSVKVMVFYAINP